MSLLVRLANRAYAMSAGPAHGRFARALTDPARAQEMALQRVMRTNVATEFGRAHGFSGIRALSEYQDAVAPRSYDDAAPEIQRMASGATNVLTAEPLRCLEPTSGSSGASKLVPYTAGLLREFSAATLPWIRNLLQHHPALREGRSFWVITPPTRVSTKTDGGVPIGLEHDSDYFPAPVRTLIDRLMVAPRALARAPDIKTCRYLTLRALLGADDLVFMSVWSPTYLSLLTTALEEDFARLLGDLETGEVSVTLSSDLRAELRRALPARPARARALRQRFGSTPPADLGELWPRLRLISCWTDGYAPRVLPPVRARFPRVEIQGKGLLATEGVVSIPWIEAGGAVAAVTSHVLEFVPTAGGRALGVHELTSGETYEVLLTTSGGLYRYRLHDLVRVEGWYHATPILSFRGRADRTSDLVGEKLSVRFAEEVVAEAGRAAAVQSPFVLLAPEWPERSAPLYHLYVEGSPENAERYASAVEAQLRCSHHYELARALGQLDPVRGIAVSSGAERYEAACVRRGARAGGVKPVALDCRGEFAQDFASGAELEASR